MGRILWYAAVTWDYIRQMLPGILLAAAVFFAVRPWRKKRLVRLELTSSPRREAALLLTSMLVSVAICCALLNLVFYSDIWWSFFIGGAMAMLWVWFVPPLLVQRRDMEGDEQIAFLEAFEKQKGPKLGLCVLGGLYSEGIDLPGERLIGAAVIGMGLPVPTARLNAVRTCYQRYFGDGFAYACRIPGMQKVLQADGRVVRSATMTPPTWRCCPQAGSCTTRISPLLRKDWRKRHAQKREKDDRPCAGVAAGSGRRRLHTAKERKHWHSLPCDRRKKRSVSTGQHPCGQRGHVPHGAAYSGRNGGGGCAGL